ncbi:MAG TPA: hypothetical protein VFA74_15655 [Terriglobales bacterium]|nr:hypothetical protein [Terriglobales bacterium]
MKFIPNPEHYLLKHSLTFQFSELFVSPSDFASALKSFQSFNPNRTPLDLHTLCKQKSAVECLATSGAWWQRAISGVKATISISERSRVVSGIIVPDAPFPQGYDKGGEIDFDPGQIFVTGSNWKNAAPIAKELNLSKGSTRASGLQEMCFVNQTTALIKKCMHEYAGSKSGGVGFLAAALPTFKFIRQTQFDFLKNGGLLVPAPFPESALNNYSFTWDLKHLISPTKERIAVSDAMMPPAQKQSVDPSVGTKLCVTISKGQKSYMPISDNFPESSCARFAQGMADGNFVFACVAKNGDVSFGGENGSKPAGGNCNWEPGEGDNLSSNTPAL